MENGDSDTDKYPHRTGHIAGSDELYGIASPQQPLPNPSPKGEGLFGSSACAQKKEQRYFTHPCPLNYLSLKN